MLKNIAIRLHFPSGNDELCFNSIERKENYPKKKVSHTKDLLELVYSDIVDLM